MTTPDTRTATSPEPEYYGWFLERARAVKEAQVASYDGTDQTTDDITTSVHVVLTSPFHLELVILSPQIDRDMALHACQMAILALRPDYVTMQADAHAANDPINPKTGESWGPGEMQAACDEDGQCAVGLLDDCLMFTTVWPDGRVRTETHRYTVTKGEGVGGSTIRWSGWQDRAVDVLDTADEVEGVRVDGLVTDVINEAYAMPPIFGDDEQVPPDALIGLTIGLIDVLSTKGYLVLAVTDNPTLRDRLQEATA